jgi:hypothetical protein
MPAITQIKMLCDTLKTVPKMEFPKIIRLIFIKETLILAFGLVWLWFSISLYVDSHYSVQDLKPHSGEIELIDSSIIKVKDKPLFKEVTKQLQVTLLSDVNTYTIETTENFGELISKISVGDSVTIYTKPKFWGIFGLKKSTIVNHWTKGKEIIIDYSTYKTSISGLFYLTLIFSIILILVYIAKLKKRLWWDFDGYKSDKGIA